MIKLKWGKLCIGIFTFFISTGVICSKVIYAANILNMYLTFRANPLGFVSVELNAFTVIRLSNFKNFGSLYHSNSITTTHSPFILTNEKK